MRAPSPPATGMAVYRRLLSYVRPYWKLFIIAAVGMLFYAVTDTAFAALMKPLLDGTFVERDPFLISMVPLALIAIFVVRGGAGFVGTYYISAVGTRVVRDLRGQLFDRFLHLPAAYYDNSPSGVLLAKLTYNVDQVSQASSQAVTVLIRDTLTIIGLLAWMLYLNFWLTLIILIVGPFSALVVVYVAKRFRRISVNIQHTMGEVTQIAQEAIEGHRVIKAFGGQEYEAAQFDRVNDRNRRLNMKMVTTEAAASPVMQLIAACALALVIYLATLEPVLETITVGTFISFIAALLLMLPPIKRLTSVNAALQRGIAAGQSIFAILDLDAERDTGTRTLGRASGRVEYRDVRFSYSPKAQPVLCGIDFCVEPGETVAIVGRSGSGKSTLVNLLPRFYDPSGGHILLDGIDTRELRLADLRDQIAMVGQEVTLFNDTIARNIAYGRLQDASEAEIIRAAQAAHAWEFIEALPQGLETVVGENGVLLSGGQRQRLAIARALLKNAPILILDEATSALDTRSERYIQAGLETLMRDRTTLVIAHRLSTVERADLILVLQEGRVVERGRHHELLALGGQYAALHQMQFDEAVG
jgi:ATP-binding cassette, subfamily B, bacterial MsbA